MEKRLIPYSVHLPEHIYIKIKQAAGDRKASGIVRDAIVSFIEKEDLFKSGFNSGVNAAIKKVSSNKIANSISVSGTVIANELCSELGNLIK